MEEFQPGQVIHPGTPPSATAVTTEAAPPPPAPLFQSPAAAPVPPPVPVETGRPSPSSPPPPLQPAQPISLPDSQPAVVLVEDPTEDGVLTWTATEYLQPEKDATWYGAYTLGTILVTAAVFFLTRDVVSTAVVLVACGGLIYAASHRPREQTYSLEDGLLFVGRKGYRLDAFKAFSAEAQGEVVGMTLIPLKRFMPPVMVYVQGEQAGMVQDHLAAFLPLEAHKADAVDGLLRKIRF